MRLKVHRWNWSKQLATACTAVLLTGFACMPAHASVGEIHCSGSNWTLSISGPQLTLDGSHRCNGSLIVPDNFTSLDVSAFDGQTGLTSIYLPDSITSIGHHAFAGCSGLKSVRLPAGLQELPMSAFDGASALTSISLPRSLTTIGQSAFYHATALRSIVIPEGVTQLPDDLFNGASALNSVTLPSTLQGIGNRVFYGAASLTSITIPDGVTSIGQAAFQNNFALESIYLPDSVTQIGEDSFNANYSLTTVRLSNQITSIPANAFYSALALRNLRIPSSVTSIGASAFYGNNALESLTIPRSVTSIGASAFESSTSLHRIYIMDDSSLAYGSGAFDGIASEATFFIKGVSASAHTITMLGAANGGINYYQHITGNHSLSFDANGATKGDLPYVDNPMPGGSFTAAENTGGLVKSGFTFGGWNAKADGSGITYEAGKTYEGLSTSSDTTLYAKWVAAPTSSDSSTPTSSAISKAISFNSGSSLLTAAAKSKLKKNLASYKASASIQIVGGAGYTTLSNKASVVKLAKARSNAIKKYLVKLGVSKSKISISVKSFKIGLVPRSQIVSVTSQ